MAGDKWSEEEYVLVLDAYLNRGAKAYSEHEEVQELSEIIDRSADSIGLRIANFRHVNPKDDVKGMKRGGEKTKEIWNKYKDDRDNLGKEAERLRMLKNGLKKSNFLDHNIRKFTGSVEHWITTYHTGFWGLEEKYREDFEEIRTGDVFLLHASGPDYLESTDTELRNMNTGVIGIGVVGGKSEKEEPQWIAELNGEGNWPLLVHFSEVYWFGDIKKVDSAPVADKDTTQRIEESKHLLKDVISFSEMKEYSDGYQISPQRSINNVKHPERIEGLILDRMESSYLKTYDTHDKFNLAKEEPEDLSEKNLESSTPSLMDITWEDSGEDKNHGVETTKTKINKKAQREANRTHQETLLSFRDYLSKKGYSCVETNLSDLIAEGEEDLILGEVKSITSSNKKSQVRKAVGQLAEYEFFDLLERDFSQTNKINLDNLKDVEVRKILILSDSPEGEYKDYLSNLSSIADIEVFAKKQEEFEKLN